MQVFEEAINAAMKYKESGSDDFMAEVMDILDNVSWLLFALSC